MEKRFLSTQEIADILNVSPRYVTLLIKRGELKGYKVGREWRIEEEELEEFLRRRFMRGKFKT